MDYIDYALNQYMNEVEKADQMNKLGIETEEEYMSYIEDQKDFYNECRFEKLED